MIRRRTMKVTIIPIVIGAFGTAIKWLLKGLVDLEVEGRVETIQTTALWERPEYWEESWRLEETCCHSNSSERPSANAGGKSSYNNNIQVSNKQNITQENLDRAKKGKSYERNLISSDSSIEQHHKEQIC